MSPRSFQLRHFEICQTRTWIWVWTFFIPIIRLFSFEKYSKTEGLLEENFWDAEEFVTMLTRSGTELPSSRMRMVFTFLEESGQVARDDFMTFLNHNDADEFMEDVQQMRYALGVTAVTFALYVNIFQFCGWQNIWCIDSPERVYFHNLHSKFTKTFWTLYWIDTMTEWSL